MSDEPVVEPRVIEPRVIEPVEIPPRGSELDDLDQRTHILAIISDAPLDERAIEDFVLDRVNGALVSFRGIVRDHDHGESVTALDYQAHPDAQRFIEQCCRTVAEESGLAVAAAHRVGALAIGDIALVAAVAAPHRAEAFAACQRLVELIKAEVPIWKRQHLAAGASEWVGL